MPESLPFPQCFYFKAPTNPGKEGTGSLCMWLAELKKMLLNFGNALVVVKSGNPPGSGGMWGCS